MEAIPTSELEETQNIYSFPFPGETEVGQIVEINDAHTGPYKGALDFPMQLGTPILAPLDGQVFQVVDSNDKYGPQKENEPFLNEIIIKHKNGEISQLAHLAQGSALVKVGDEVKTGQQIALTGNSGWMTEPHLHFFVCKLTKEKPGFMGLMIRFDKDKVLLES